MGRKTLYQKRKDREAAAAKERNEKVCAHCYRIAGLTQEALWAVQEALWAMQSQDMHNRTMKEEREEIIGAAILNMLILERLAEKITREKGLSEPLRRKMRLFMERVNVDIARLKIGLAEPMGLLHAINRNPKEIKERLREIGAKIENSTTGKDPRNGKEQSRYEQMGRCDDGGPAKPGGKGARGVRAMRRVPGRYECR